MRAVQELREDFRTKKRALLATIRASVALTREVSKTLTQLSTLADVTLRTLWEQAGLSDGPCALVAVGGYGRAKLFPHSDVDVLLLLPDDERPENGNSLQSQIETFIGSCWDTGLEIGSSVRTVSQCLAEADKDVTVQTSVLESRLVVGNRKLYALLAERLTEAMDPKAFFVAKTLEMRQRHNKFEDTPYALEPNCKESPGGLRDLQMLLWVSKAAGMGKNWDELARTGLATQLEVRQIKRNEALMRLIRMRLHLIADRREDRLVFDLQTAVAESFGYRTPSNGTVPFSVGLTETSVKSQRKITVVRASEALMRRYYWAAKAITQLNQIVLLNIEERLYPSAAQPQPINAWFNDKAGMIDVVSDDLYVREPHAILQTFLLYQTTSGTKGLSSRTLRALYNARSVMDAKFRNDPVNRATFLQIIKEHDGVTHAIRLMNQTSVLGRYLWVFRRIVGQMQHDLFHVYTVDQHILMVLRNMRRFFIVEHAHEYPLCSQLAAGWDKPWVLYVAALFHDIAKGRGGDHSKLGASSVRLFCRQHGIAREDARMIEFLVREHLTMSHTAQKTDLTDPDVVLKFAEKVGSERRLTALYLLTVADIRGTSPKVWNAWKGKLLEDLYKYTSRALGGEAPDPQAEVESRKREALVMIALHALPHEAHKKLWETLDVGYFMRHDAADIAWHTRHLSRYVGSDKPIVRARRSLVGEGLQIMVYTRDKTDLFARICGYFDGGGFSILDARIHTARNGYALDTFQVVTAAMPEHYRELTSMVESGLAQAIADTAPLREPGRGRVSRRVKSFPITPRVTLRPDEKGQRWLLNITAGDRVGLLYAVARILARHDINLQLAKIATLGERVDDTFLIDGAQLQYNRDQIAVETELLRALN
jgi:[protein-PII] uridylyltransferase